MDLLTNAKIRPPAYFQNLNSGDHINFMKPNIWMKITIAMVIFLLGIYLIGVSFSTRCLEYKECKSCFHIMDSKEKYNAVVDYITCLCSEALKDGYQDVELNQKIENNYKMISGIDASVKEICEGKVPLVKYNITE